MPARVDQIDGLHLHLLSGADDPLSGLWNDLISAQHPCGDAPLVGAQLRYLIGSDHGWLGALGFGPAAWILGARDEWIGWSVPARKRNLPQVVSLARLLIRREVRCANLASKVLALALARLPDDWQARYGLRPLLVETFVDRDHFIGRTFLAANWRRLGTSQGRGRLGPQTPSKTPKDIYVFPLHDQARPLLQVEPPRPVPRARSWAAWPTAPGGPRNWPRWTWATPAWSVALRPFWLPAPSAPTPRSTAASTTATKANAPTPSSPIPIPDLTLPRLLEAHAEATLARLAASNRWCSCPRTPPRSTTRACAKPPAWGRSTTAAAAASISAQPLGLATRGRAPGRAPRSVLDRLEVPAGAERGRNAQSIDEKESRCWLEALRTAASAARRLPHTTLVTLTDRGGDLYELHDLVQAGPPNLHAVVRAQHDRNLESHQKLWAFMAAQPLGRRTSIDVPRQAGPRARTATVEVRWAPVTISPPAVPAKRTWPPWACGPCGSTNPPRPPGSNRWTGCC